MIFDFLFGEPSVEHSLLDDGRHQFITDDDPPLKMLPVAPNHYRAGYFLATLITAKLAELDGELPPVLTLTRGDIGLSSSLAETYPEIESEAAEVRVRLVLHDGPQDDDKNDENSDEEESEAHITPLPPDDWAGDYDNWVMHVCRSLGVDAPAPCGPKGYEEAMAGVASTLNNRLPELRRRFRSGMDGQNLGFKIALATNSGGKEFVWIRATDWNDESNIVGVLESDPCDCPKYIRGQSIRVPISDLTDFGIGSESGGLIDGGLTQRIAEDFGRVIG